MQDARSQRDHLIRHPARPGPLTAEPQLERAAPPAAPGRPRVHGKFLYVGDQKLYVRGATYGTFRPGPAGSEFPTPDLVARDFVRMAAAGLNAVRTYTVPPCWLLDAAAAAGLYVMVGLPWEQHVTFLERGRARQIEARLREAVRGCAGHPAILCYAIGNEIPAPIVRWYGGQRIVRFLERLARVARAEDPAALVTYVNYPSTEYLELPFLDFVSFNVYLESTERLAAYLARLQNLAGERPLVMAELGLDSQRHGCQQQAAALGAQLRTAFGGGCAGAFVFAWTDEWHRGGFDVEDWDFGLVDRQRRPKPALAAVQAAVAELPFPAEPAWPKISVVVCSYNGARTIRDTCLALRQVEYPDFEVIVVDDGSTDATAAIAREYGFQVISTENRGLSSARNTGLAAASGEIIAYTDDDAYPDPHWLQYLATAFMTSDYAGIGGPNIPPPGDGLIADCVANAPGGPIHVLLTDTEAEHIPGCNMAYRRERLEAVGGFDPRFRAAGDDVDLCWRLQERGWKLGFSPAAVVWHHRRNSVRAYWKQQHGYGKAEALLEQKWPTKYNTLGHVSWGGQLYGRGLPQLLLGGRGRIYHGTWGSAPFQSIYQPATSSLASLVLMPEWYLVALGLLMTGTLGLLWPPLLLALPLLGLVVAVTLAQAALSAAQPAAGLSRRRGLAGAALGLTALLHLLQPLARLCGRLRHGLTPWRLRGLVGVTWPWPRQTSVWSERWRAADDWLQTVEAWLHERNAVTLRGDGFDHWDLEVRAGALGAARTRLAIEEHGAGRQLVRFRTWPRLRRRGLMLLVGLSGAGLLAWLDGASAAAAILLLLGAVHALRTISEAACAKATLRQATLSLASSAAGAPQPDQRPTPEGTGAGGAVVPAAMPGPLARTQPPAQPVRMGQLSRGREL